MKRDKTTEKDKIKERTGQKREKEVLQNLPVLSQHAVTYREKKEREKRKKHILLWVFSVLAVLFLIASFIAPYIIKDKNSWLYSMLVTNTINFHSIADFFVDNLDTVIRSAIIVIVFYFVITFIVIFLKKILSKSKRQRTVVSMIASFIQYIGYFIMLTTVLAAWGVNTTAMLSGVALFSAVIAFGAQSLVSDILAGIFMVFENNFSVGEMVNIEGFRGCVEEIGIRTTQIRSDLGEVLIIGNSQMKKIINLSAHRSTVVCTVHINHSEDLDRVEKIINDNMYKIGEGIPNLTDGPKYIGVSNLATDGILQLKIIGKCDNQVIYQTQRDLNGAIKRLFDRHKIEYAITKEELLDFEMGKSRQAKTNGSKK